MVRAFLGSVVVGLGLLAGSASAQQSGVYCYNRPGTSEFYVVNSATNRIVGHSYYNHRHWCDVAVNSYRVVGTSELVCSKRSNSQTDIFFVNTGALLDAKSIGYSDVRQCAEYLGALSGVPAGPMPQPIAVPQHTYQCYQSVQRDGATVFYVHNTKTNQFIGTNGYRNRTNCELVVERSAYNGGRTICAPNGPYYSSVYYPIGLLVENLAYSDVFQCTERANRF